MAERLTLALQLRFISRYGRELFSASWNCYKIYKIMQWHKKQALQLQETSKQMQIVANVLVDTVFLDTPIERVAPQMQQPLRLVLLL